MKEEYEIVFKKEGVSVRKKDRLPFVDETWTEKMISYEEMQKNSGDMVLTVTSVKPEVEDNILKSIKLKVSEFNYIPTEPDIPIELPPYSDSSIELPPIKMVSPRNYVKQLRDGTHIKFKINGIEYLTKVDIYKGEYKTLNRLIQNKLGKDLGRRISVNIYNHIYAKYYENGKWIPLEKLKQN